MNKVSYVLKSKGDRVWTVPVEATVLEALQLMAEKQTSSVVVMDGEKIAGIFTERDFARKLGLFESKPGAIPVGRVMSRELITVTPDDTVNRCMEIMTEKHIRHLPVIQEGRLVGIVSIGDLVKDTIEELQFMVEQLENYITGFR
jgi:CBS domain-containing protein